MTSSTAVRTLGLVSIGFGIFDCLAAVMLADRTGMESAAPYRIAGVREIVTGVAAVAAPANPAPLIARLVGDVVDIVTLSATAARPGNPRRSAAMLGVGIVLAVSVADAVVLAGQRRHAEG